MRPNTRSLFQRNLRLASVLALAAFAGCATYNDPYGGGYGGSGSGYGNPGYYGGGYGSGPYYGNGPSYGGSDYYRREQRELDRERRRLEEERERLERERQRQQEPPTYMPPASRQPIQDRCPPGFSPSEQKCSPEERRRGCRDIRLNSGMGCVDRN